MELDFDMKYSDEKEFLTNNLNEINQILIKLKEEYKYNPNKGTKMNLTVMENQKRNIVLKLWLLKDNNVNEKGECVIYGCEKCLHKK